MRVARTQARFLWCRTALVLKRLPSNATERATSNAWSGLALVIR